MRSALSELLEYARAHNVIINSEQGGELLRVCYGNKSEIVLPKEPSWSLDGLIPASSDAHIKSILSRVRAWHENEI